MGINIRPAAFIPCVFIGCVIVEILVFLRNREETDRLKMAVKLMAWKFVSVCLPYLTLLIINRDDANVIMDASVTGEYIREADEFLYERFIVSPAFIVLFLIIELPLFVLSTKGKEDRGKQIRKFVLVNVVFAAVMLLIDFVVCRAPALA